MGDLLIQVAAFNEFQGKVWAALVVADFVNLDDVGMLQASHRLRFHQTCDGTVDVESLPGM